MALLPDGPGGWKDRVRLPDGTYPWVHIEAASRQEAAEAFDRMRAVIRIQRQAQRRPRATGALTVARWMTERWAPSRRNRGLRNVDCDMGRLDKHVLGIIGQTPIVAVTPGQLEALVVHLDALTHLPKAEGGISWKSAVCIWGLVSKAFDDAARAKDPTLRVRADNPAENVRGPDRGSRKDKTFLYPSEFLELWTHPLVPLRWKRMVAVAVYTALRSSELRALRWPDVDLEHGVIHVHVQRRKTDGPVSRLKSHTRAHHVAIEPALVPVLEAMKESAVDDRVCPMPPLHAMSTRLRRYLWKAGVRREELHAKASDPTRKALTWHDLRGTGLTWWAARGDAPMLIMQRAGHAAMSTTMGYVQLAEAIGAGMGEVFPSLHQACTKVAPEVAKPYELPGAVASPTRFELVYQG